MRTTILSLCLLVSCCATTALSQPPVRGGKAKQDSRRPLARGERPVDPVLDALDVDHDKTISAAELLNASAALRSLDKDRDGVLTSDEFRLQTGGTSSSAPAASVAKAVEKESTVRSADESLNTATAIQWFATLNRGLAEAERTGKPILFVSGNPSCAGVSGMWCPGKGIIDSTYLHRPEVVEAAKKYVCIRLTAYEDETERVFMSKLVLGQVSNTSFAILAPDGTPAVHNRGTGKGPSGLFKNSTEMAKGMDEIATRFHPKIVEGVPELPIALNAKVGMVVAAADNQPLVLVLAPTLERQKELEKKVAELAWSKAFSGRFVYATASSMSELPKIQGHTIADGILMIEPDTFGAGGKLVAEVPGDQSANQIANAMRKTVQNFVPIQKNRRYLAVLGLQEGIFYETGIPVSGQGEASDRERYKQRLDQWKGN